MSDTPDLDRAREAAFKRRKNSEHECCCPPCVESEAKSALEQRAEEAERLKAIFKDATFSPRAIQTVFSNRAASLRSQIGGKP